MNGDYFASSTDSGDGVRKKWPRAALAGWVTLAVLLLVPGCKRTLSQKELDQARVPVETALQAWQKGDRPDSLQQLSPPIRFHDEDWSKGLRLTGWEIASTNGSAGDLTPRCEVVLSLVDRKGKKVSRRVVYQIETKDTIVIVRDPYF